MLPQVNIARLANSNRKPSFFKNIARVKNQIYRAYFRIYKALFSKQM